MEKETTKRPLILISNDDGYHAKGINRLTEWVKDLADIIVCAPESARSGFSRAFSATIPLTLKQRRQYDNVEVWSCNGTPVDCVKMALAELCPRRPDMVIGGINHGDNASVNTHYSGTMGVTMEGCMKYIPSVAFSLCDPRSDADFEPLRPYVLQVTRRVLREGLPKGVCLNINFPLVDEFKGVRVCRMSHGTWDREVSRYHHPRGYDYWWMVGHYQNDEPQATDTDRWALDNGYISIVPEQVDVTAYTALDALRKWDFSSDTWSE